MTTRTGGVVLRNLYVDNLAERNERGMENLFIHFLRQPTYIAPSSPNVMKLEGVRANDAPQTHDPNQRHCRVIPILARTATNVEHALARATCRCRHVPSSPCNLIIDTSLFYPPPEKL